MPQDADATAAPDDLVQLLDGQVPVALLPVRLETRFTDDGATLRIRIFPDDIAVHTHEPELTDSEQRAARDYWKTRLGAPEDPDAARSAWRELAAVYGVARGEWLVRAMTPTNLDDPGGGAPVFGDVPLRDAAWTRPARVAAMPRRWVALGLRGGGERFRRWGAVIPDGLAFGPAPDPNADDETELLGEPEPRQDDLPIDEGMRWLVDYDEAERIGMAITVTGADLNADDSLARGLDQLIVLGVDWTRSPDDGAEVVRGLLEAHRHTEGLGLIAAGTPTNNTAAASTPSLAESEAAVDARDPAVGAPTPGPTSHAQRLAAALGLTDATPLVGVQGGDLDDGAAASHMHNVLWEATWGYFFDHLLDGVVTDAQVADLRAHFRAHVRGGGPLTPLRIGDQPYGVLPVVAPGSWRPGDGEADAGALMGVLDDARGLWLKAAGRSPHMGRTGDPERDLVELLQHTPTMTTVRFRTVFGPLLTANASGLSSLGELQKLTAKLAFAMLGTDATSSRLAACLLHPTTRRLTVPLVQGGDAGDVLAPNYLSSIAQRLTRSGGFVMLREDDPASLLHALLLHGAQLEMGKAARNLILMRRPSPGPRPIRVARGPEPELVDVEKGGNAADTPLRIAGRVVADVSGRQTLADHIATIPRRDHGRATVAFAEFRASVGHLAGLGVAELERLFAETLDCSSHRLDAWLTSFATRRLQTVRAARSTGIGLGGFGWVEDLRPGANGRSEGFVHTPSLAHAHTAAILRSGHLEHRSDEGNPLAVDLSSQRVREALALLDGMRQGQPIGALLGYRFERALRERDARLARYILTFRGLAPLRSDTDADDGTGAVEAIAARDVVDGVALLRLWRSKPPELLSRAEVAGSDRTAVGEELDRLDDRLDAVGDLFVAESVFQAVTGNVERAGAAATALDRQQPPPEPDIVRTPRTGHDHVYRVAVLLGDDALPQAWAGAPTDPRAAAEPMLNAWAAHQLGDPARIRCAAEVLDATGEVVETLEASLPDLGLSPLSVLAVAGSGGANQPTELEERLALHLSTLVTNPDRAAELRLLTGRLASWRADALSLGDLLTVAGAARDLMGAARPLDAADLALPEEDLTRGIDVAELTARGQGVLAAADQAAEALARVVEAPAVTAQEVRAALASAAAVGARGAIPVTLGSDAAAVVALREQTEAVGATLGTSLGEARRLLAAEGAPVDPVEAVTAAIRALLGADFPVLPRVVLPDPAACAASLADRGSLTDGDELAPTMWLQRRAQVRPQVGRLAEVLTHAELCGAGTGPTDLGIIQLPHVPGDRWVAADLDPDRTLPSGRLAVVAHLPRPVDVAGPLAGLVVDDWLEQIPSASETTGVAFGFDAPGGRAPQAVLLAVPPDPAARTWTVETLRDTVLEALELTRIRAVDPREVWMAGRVLPALYVTHNVAGDTSSVNVFQMQARHGVADGATIATGEG